jgi:hypothetical protein
MAPISDEVELGFWTAIVASSFNNPNTHVVVAEDAVTGEVLGFAKWTFVAEGAVLPGIAGSAVSGLEGGGGGGDKFGGGDRFGGDTNGDAGFGGGFGGGERPARGGGPDGRRRQSQWVGEDSGNKGEEPSRKRARR